MININGMTFQRPPKDKSELAQWIKNILEQGGHVQFRRGAEYGHITDSGVQTIRAILDSFVELRGEKAGFL